MKRVINLIILLIVILSMVSCTEYEISPDNTMWYSDELEIYVQSGSYHMPRIRVGAVVKTTESGIYTEVLLTPREMSFSFSINHDINTPDHYANISNIPFRYEEDIMIIDFTSIESPIFERKEKILHQKPLSESLFGLVAYGSVTLTSLDRTREISQFRNHIIINGEEMVYRFQLNWDNSFICIVYSNPLNEDGTYSYADPVYYYDLIATGYVTIEDNIYTLVFEKDLIFNNSLEGLQCTAR